MAVRHFSAASERYGELYLYIQSVPRSKHSINKIQYKTSQLMLYRELIAVCSQIHIKHINVLCGHKVELLKVKPGGTNNNHHALILKSRL